MNLFGIGPLELLMVLVIALLVLGPGRMVSTGRKLGKFVREVRRATEDLPTYLEDLVEPEDGAPKSQKTPLANPVPFTPKRDEPRDHQEPPGPQQAPPQGL